MARYWPRSFIVANFLMTTTESVLWERKKTELDQYLGHRNLIRLYNNRYIIMLP